MESNHTFKRSSGRKIEAKRAAPPPDPSKPDVSKYAPATPVNSPSVEPNRPIAVVMAMLIATAATIPAAVFAGHHGHHHGENGGSTSTSQGPSQSNSYGGSSDCSNQGSQISGNGNRVSQSSDQRQ